MSHHPHAPSGLAAALYAALVTIAAGPALAGPINPPSGPVTPTAKPLAEVEPRIALNATNTPGSGATRFRITQSGSYYLTADVQGLPGGNGIEVTAPRVTIDLNGFTLSGGPGSLSGIVNTVGSTVTSLTVRNGTVRDWGSDGVSFGVALNYLAADLIAESNGGIGISGGFNGIIRDCAARDNDGDGIRAGDPSVIERCVAVFNGGDGIDARFGECVITRCVSYVNTGAGIRGADNCIISDNECSFNTGPGVLVTNFGNRIEANNIRGGPGIEVTTSGNLIIRNSVNGFPAYNLAANNRYGPIINLTGAASAPVNGQSATGSLTTSDPWANFSY